MKTDKFPITIAGQTYYVDRTFDSSPTVFEVVGTNADGPILRHVDSPEGDGNPLRTFGAGAKVGDVLIFASKGTRSET